MQKHFFFNKSSFFSALIFLSVLSSSNVSGQGNLLLTPRRVVFEGNKRAQVINLANTGQETATYNISVIQYRMKEDGSFEEITEPDSGQNFADKYFRFYPRTVTLAANEAQTIRMQLIRTDQLSSGEYRSHMYFRAVPNLHPLGQEESQEQDSITISVRLTAVFGIAIPVIIRVGESTTQVNISDLKMEENEDEITSLLLRFNRMGNMSVYGDLTVEHVSPQGKVTQVGIARGVAIYTPNLLRRIRMNLDKKANVNYHSGKILVKYNSQSDIKPEILASGELLLH